MNAIDIIAQKVCKIKKAEHKNFSKNKDPTVDFNSIRKHNTEKSNSCILYQWSFKGFWL